MDKSQYSVKDSQIMDIIEFGRTIHAEMSAICDASRNGISIEGATLFTTIFPCHLCAEHIVASGVVKVVYIEPYPKSYASNLHRDSIQVDSSGDSNKVVFEQFIGVSPYRYRDLLERGKQKYSGGLAKKWCKDQKEPMIDVYFPMCFRFEMAVVESIKEDLEELLKKKSLFASVDKQEQENLS